MVVDTSSTHNFLDPSVAKKGGLDVNHREKMRVKWPMVNLWVLKGNV